MNCTNDSDTNIDVINDMHEDTTATNSNTTTHNNNDNTNNASNITSNDNIILVLEAPRPRAVSLSRRFSAQASNK